MRAPSYEKLSKKALIDRLIEAERQLRKVGAEKGPRSAIESAPDEKPDPTPVRKDPKRARTARPDGADIKSASEKDYTVLDHDGRIRRLYKVVKDIRDDAGKPVFSEGALYEINSTPCAGSDMDHPGVAGESDQTELICRFRPNGALTFVNEAYCRYFGCDREDLQDRNILLSISEADREKVYSRLKDLRPERPVDTFEYRVVGVFGDILWNQWTYRALFDDSGNILEYQSVGRDITFRKYTQDILEKRAAILEAVTFAAEGFLKGSSWRDRIERVLERLGAAMNASHVFLCENRIGAQGDIAVLRSYEWITPQVKAPGKRKKFLRSSKLAVRFSRWVHEKSEGRPIFGTIGQFPDGEVEDLALDKKLSIAVVPVLMGDRWWGFIGFADYSGEIQWSEDEIAPLGAASEILGAAIEREAKERALEESHAILREQEQFLAGVFDAIQDGIMVAAPDMTILRVNKTIEKRFPHAPTLPGRKCYEAYYGLNSPCRDCASQKTLKTGKSASMTRSVTGPDGEIKVWVDVFSYPWIDEKTGQLKGVIEYSRDITERKKAEEELAKTRILLEQAFEQSPYPMALVSMPDAVVRIANPAIREFLEITDEPTPVGQSLFEMNMSWKDCDPQGNPVPLAELPLPLALKGEKTVNREIMAVTKNGTVRHELVSGVPISNDKGNILAGYLVCTDITERKRAEDARRQSEERLQIFLNSFRDPVFLKDSDRRYLFVNEAGLSLLGRTREETIGKTDSEMFDASDSAEKEKEKTDLRLLKQAGGPLLYEQRIKGRILETTKFRVNLENGRVGIGGILRDVTEQRMAAEQIRRSEELLRTFIDSSRDYIFLKDELGRNILLNRAVRECTGLAEGDLVGRTDAQLLPPAVAERSLHSDRRVLEAGTALTFQERDRGRIFEVMKFPVRFADDHTGIGGIIRDVTERQEAEEALRSSEARYRELADMLPVGIFESDLDGTVRYANSASMEMFGYGAAEVEQGINFLVAVAPEDHETAIRNLQLISEGVSMIDQEYTMVRREGSRFPALTRTRPIIREGRVVNFTGTVIDITERKRAEEALQASEALQRQLLQSIDAGVLIIDANTHVIERANSKALEMFGDTEEKVIGKECQRFVCPAEKGFCPVTDLGQGIDRSERFLLTSGGSRVPIIKTARHIRIGGDDKILETFIDITERKRAEEALRASETRYRELADNMPAGIYEATMDGWFTYVNRATLEMSGFSADDVENGVNFSKVIAPESLEALACNMRKVREGSALGYEYTMLRKDGSRFFGLTMARPLIKDGRVVGSTGIITDVSELRKAQEALRKNEALLGSILQAAPIGVGMVHDRVIGWVNEGMTMLTGYSRDELGGKSARFVYVDDEEFERAGREKYAQIQVNGKGAVETRWKRKDGSVIDVHLSSAPIDTQNLGAGVVFTALDITAQKKAARILLFAKEDLEKQVAEQMRELDVANMLLKIELEEHRKTEEALVKSEHLYRAIVEDQTELICRFLPDGTLSFVNEAFCRYFGKSRDEVLGTRYLPSIHREDLRKVLSAYGSLTPHRPVLHLEFRIEMPDGVRWVHWTNRAVYDATGTLVEHQGVARDVTERIQSEQQIRESRNMLRSVFDGISDPLIMVREDMTLIMLNRAALRFFGALLYRDLIGTPCLEFFQGRYGEEATYLVQAVIAEQEPARHELATKGDSARYEEVFVYPVHAGGGNRSMAIIRITDRTKQRLMEQELIQSEKLASLGLLISGIVHEINNPNNFISFNMPILRDYLQEILPVLDEHAAKTPHYEVQGMPYAEFRADVMKLLENIEHGSTRINTTVAKLKEFSRKKDEKGARRILPADVIERAVAICHTQIRKTVKTFDVQVQQDMPEMVSDPDAIEQTLINLLINAAQAADKPDSHIRLKAWRGISGMEGLVLEVEDNGCGMDAKTASRIFDPFFTTKEEKLGTGLGLYISKNLLESVGGFITVESETGRGTAFRVVLPDLKDPDRREKSSGQKGVGA